MGQEKNKIAGWKFPVGCLISAVVALLSPIAMFMTILMGTPLIMLPMISLVFLYGFGGRRTYIAAVGIQIFGAAILMGSEYMFITMLIGTIPSIFVVRAMAMRLHFGVQVRVALVSSIIGAIAAAIVASLLVGGNIVEWAFDLISEAMRTLPDSYQTMLTQSLTMLDSVSVNAAELMQMLQGTLEILLPSCKLRFPAALMGGAIISAMLGLVLGNYCCHKYIGEKDTGYMPMREWALPGGMTFGLLLILVVSYILYLMNFTGGEAAFIAVMTIAECAFCIQAFSSIARKMRIKPLKRWQRAIIVVLLAVGLCVGCEFYIAIYGCASAIFGSHGAIKQYRQNKDNSENQNEE